jgi:hypothetical protein
MKQIAMILAATMAITATAQRTLAQSSTAQEMSVGQARRAIVENSALAYVVPPGFRLPQVDPRSWRFSTDTIEFDTIPDKKPSEHLTIDLKLVLDAAVQCTKGSPCKLTVGHDRHLPNSVPRLQWDDSRTRYGCSSSCEQQARNFVAALSRLAVFASDPNDPEHNFPAQLAAWRALAIKPQLPDAVRVRRMMAEDALKNQRPKDALKYYEQGLRTYPTWPEGWFNAALLASELNRYADAVEYMQNYLLLVPNAADAKAARDQIEIWKIKAGQ